MKYTLFRKKKDFDKFYQLPYNQHNFGEGYKSQGYQWYKWAGTDSYNAFQTNLDKLQYWIDNPFAYRVNKQGFRTNIDFDKHKGEVSIALGCSNTFGVGMPEEWIWSTLMAEHIGHPIVNLGIGGAGVDHAYLALHHVIDKLDIKNVFHFHQVFGRRLRVDYESENNKKLAVLSFQDHNHRVYEDTYWKNVMVDEGMIDFEHKRAIDAIAGMCYGRGIRYYNFNSPPHNKYFVRDNYDVRFISKSKLVQIAKIEKGDIYARDLIHPSRFQHRAIAQRFIDHLHFDSHIESFNRLGLDYNVNQMLDTEKRIV